MPFRLFSTPDGRRWRVWAVHPKQPEGERRGADRRVTPVELVLDPPVIERRRGRDRRSVTATPGDPAPTDGRSPAGAVPLAASWRDGWLVFEAEESTGTPLSERDLRRLSPIPPDWERCSDAELLRHFEHAVGRRVLRPPGAPRP